MSSYQVWNLSTAWKVSKYGVILVRILKKKRIRNNCVFGYFSRSEAESTVKQYCKYLKMSFRGGSRTAATSKMERFMIIVNGWKPLTIITKGSILDFAVVLDPPLSLLRSTWIMRFFFPFDQFQMALKSMER